MPDQDTTPVEKRVQAALKATIETNLVRERMISANVSRFPGAAYFSNGIIFSKSGNGTPFSNGIFFSKTGAQFTLERDETAAVQDLATLDHAAFTAFTDRLLRLKEVKDIGRATRGH